MQYGQQVWLETYQVNYPLSIEEFIHVAIAIAEAVHDLHRKNEIIGVLTPANIKLSIRPYLAQITELMTWNNAYKAPEYDSRLKINPSQQSDLYSLGIIYYEMLAGVLPYNTSADDSDWYYIHQIHSPRSLIEQRDDLPAILQNIIFKLLSKAPQERYSSAYGLLQDLRKCNKDIHSATGLNSFELGLGDYKQGAELGKLFVGRNDELNKLLFSLDQVIGNKSKNMLVSVFGEKGTGKTELVRQFLNMIHNEVILIGTSLEHKPAEEAAIVDAIRNGFSQLWYQDKKKILNIKDKIERECGDYISYIWTLFPVESKRLALYPQEVQEEPLDQAQLEKVLIVLIKSFSLLQMPIIIAIDDLHQADELTNRVMRSLIFEKTLSHTMIIAITSDNSTPYTRQLMQQSQSSIVENERILLLQLSRFSYEDVRLYIERLVHEDSKPMRLLARIAYDVSMGNVEQLKLLVLEWLQSNKLHFNYHQGVWVWGEIIEDEAYHLPSDSLILYKEAYDRLDDEVKKLLHIASVIGMKFSIEMLSEIYNEKATKVISLLGQAEREGIICQEDSRSAEHGNEIEYLFMHNQLQLLLYQQFLGEAGEWHYKIGCLFYGDYTQYRRIEDSLGAAKHWNRVHNSLSLEQQEALVQLNLINAKHNNWVRKHQEAVIAAEAGIALLEALDRGIEQKFEYYIAAAIGEHMLGNPDRSYEYLKTLMDNYDKFKKQDKLLLLQKQLEIYTFVNNEEAYRIGEVGLSEIGWDIPKKVSPMMMVKEVIKTQLQLRKFRKDNVSLRINNEEEYIMLNELLIGILIPSVNIDPVRMLYILARYMQYCLNEGVTELFVASLGAYELIVQREMKLIYRWLPTESFTHFEQVLVENGLQSYRMPLINGLYHQLDDTKLAYTYWRRVIRRAIDHKDIVIANVAMTFLLSSYYGDINELRELHHYLEGEAREYVDEKSNELLSITKNYSLALADEQNARSYIAHSSMEESHPWYVLICSYKMELSYLLAEYEQALMWADRALSKVNNYDLIHRYRLELFKALASAARYRTADEGEKKEIALLVKKLAVTMKQWHGLWGEGSSAHHLIQGEYYRIARQEEKAIGSYNAAIKQAQSEGYYLIQAIAGERLFEYRLANGEQDQAVMQLMDAGAAYATWGITGKLDWMRNKYPHIHWYYTQVKEGQLSNDGQTASKELDDKGDHIQAEVAAAQQLPSQYWKDSAKAEGDPWEFIGQTFNTTTPYRMQSFLELVVKQLGGTRISLIDIKSTEYTLAYTAGRPVTAEIFHIVPLSIIRYVLNTEQPFIIDDAVENLMLNDSYVLLHQPRSIICVPFGHTKSGNKKLLYMENSDIAGQFTERTLQLLELFITRYMYLNLVNDKEVYDQARYNQDEHAEKDVRSGGLVESLTQREQEILMYIHNGLSNKEIASELQISEATVKTHITNLYGKLGVKRRSQAVVRARELNLFTPKS